MQDHHPPDREPFLSITSRQNRRGKQAQKGCTESGKRRKASYRPSLLTVSASSLMLPGTYAGQDVASLIFPTEVRRSSSSHATQTSCSQTRNLKKEKTE